MADVEPRLPQVQHATRVGRRDDGVGRRPAAAPPTLRSRMLVATARAASTAYAPPAPQHSPSSSVSASVVRGRRAPCGPRRARCCTCRRWHGSCTTTRGVRGAARAGTSWLRDPLGEVADARAERRGLRRAEQRGRSPSSPRRTRRCSTTTGASPGIDAITRRASAARVVVAAGVQVQRAAAVAARGRAARRARRPRASRATVDRCVSRSHASITQPVKHHASGAPPTGTSSGRRERARREARQPEPARDEAQRAARPTRSQVNAMSSAVPRSTPVRDPLGRARARVTANRARSAAPRASAP